MNREQRRQEERERKKNPNRTDRAYWLGKDSATKKTVDLLLNAFCVTMHDQCGFGQKRIMKILQDTDELMNKTRTGELSWQDIRDMCVEKTGIKIHA